MKKKIVVAVIDSGVDTTDEDLRNTHIQDIYYENREFKQCYIGKVNEHGTEVIKVLLKEAPDIQIVSIRILQEDNKCSMTAIVDAVYYAMEIKVDVINLSLGSCVKRTRKVEELESACNEAIAQGIIVFAADNNDPMLSSYPASFENVISVNTPEDLEQYCQVRYRDRSIEFSENYVFIPDSKRFIIRRGNSFLCPMMVGLFCRFLADREHSNNVVLGFMDLLTEISRQENISKIFYDRRNSDEQSYIMNKKISFFADDMDFNNRNLFEYYKTLSKVSWSFLDFFGKSEKEIERNLAEIDILYIGVLSNVFLREQDDFIRQLVNQAVAMKKDIVTTVPIINTFDRIKIAEHEDRIIKSVYK